MDYSDYLDIEILASRKGILPSQELARGEVEQKTGYWEKTTDGHCYWYRCSCCGTKAPKNEWGNDYFSRYCPECNAEMSDIPTD